MPSSAGVVLITCSAREVALASRIDGAILLELILCKKRCSYDMVWFCGVEIDLQWFVVLNHWPSVRGLLGCVVVIVFMPAWSGLFSPAFGQGFLGGGGSSCFVGRLQHHADSGVKEAKEKW